MGYIFISYAKANRSFADQLKSELERKGYKIWLDDNNMDPNQDFTGEIDFAIREASHFIVCLTEDVKNRKESYVRREIQYALNVDKRRSQKNLRSRLPIIPIVYPKGELPVSISTWTSIFFDNYTDETEFYSDVISRIQKPPILGDLDYVIPGNTLDIANYLNHLLDFTTSKLKETVYSLLTLTATSMSSSKGGFSFTFSVSPAINTSLDTTADSRKEFGSFKEAFSFHQGKALMVGRPGAGKTTTLLAYTRDAAVARLGDATQPIPILKSIHTWHPRLSVKKWLLEDLEILIKPLEANSELNYIFILDGLDELGDNLTVYKYITATGEEVLVYHQDEIPEEVKFLEEKIDPRKVFLEEIQKILFNQKYVVSVREVEKKEIKNYCVHLGEIYLQALDVAQIKSFFIDLSLHDVWEKAQSDSSLLEMFSTPLLLGLFTFAIMPIPGQPHVEYTNLTEDNILDMFVHRRFLHEVSRQRKILFDESETRRLLYEMTANLLIYRESSSGVVVHFSEIEKIIANKKESKKFFEFCQQMHLFQKTNTNSTIFAHLKLRDYFGARGLVIRLQHSGKLFEREESAKILGYLRTGVAVSGLIDALTNAEHAVVQAQAMIALLDINTIESVSECVLQLTREKNPVVISKLLSVLDGYKGEKALSPLLKILYSSNQRNGMIFNWASNKLALFKDAALEILFSNLIKNDKSVRLTTLVLLRKFDRDERIAGKLIQFMNNYDVETRVESIKTMVVHVSDPAKYIVPLLDKKEPILVRVEAIKSLGKIKDNKQIANKLIPLLQDSNSSIRQYTVESLGCLGDEKALVGLIHALGESGINDKDKIIILQALEEIGNSEAVPVLLRNMNSKNKKIRNAVVSALDLCCDFNSLPVLVSELEDEIDLESIKVLSRLIGKMGAIEYLPKFHDMLNSPNDEFKRKAIIVLGEINHSSSMPKLAYHLKNSKKTFRKLIIDVLKKSPQGETVIADWQSRE